MNQQKPVVGFTQMKDGTKEDYLLLEELQKPFIALTVDRGLEELEREGRQTLEGYRITRLGHGLQSAIWARRDGGCGLDRRRPAA